MKTKEKDFHIWLTQEEFEVIKRVADDAALNPTAYARSTVIRAARARIAELEKLL